MHILERFRLVEFYLSYTLSEGFRAADIAHWVCAIMTMIQ
jgi:hypothetical protein